MFSARNVVRSAPRAVSRLSGAALRQTARPSAFTKAASALRPAQAAFSTTSFRKATENDGELSAKLESEIKIEEDIKASEQDPASIKDFLNNSAFELIDTPGQEIVKLVRDFGDEKSVLVPPPIGFNSKLTTLLQDHRQLLHCRYHQLRPLRRGERTRGRGF